MRRALEDEREGPVHVDGDLHGDDGPVVLLGPLVELRDELPDVDVVLAQGRADRRGRRCFSARRLQLDLRYDFFCHFDIPVEPAHRIRGAR